MFVKNGGKYIYQAKKLSKHYQYTKALEYHCDYMYHGGTVVLLKYILVPLYSFIYTCYLFIHAYYYIIFVLKKSILNI